MTDWLLYKWIWKGQSAEFRVDMQYWNMLPVLSYSRLLSVQARPANPLLPFRGSEQSHLKGLKKKATGFLSGKAIFVGEISAPNEYILYYYTNNPAVLRETLSVVRDYKGLSVSAGVEAEPDFVTYYKLLCPDDARLQSVENEAFLNGLKMKAYEKKLIHRIQMTAAFQSEADRDGFLSISATHGLIAGDCFTGDKESHPACCHVYGYSALDLENLNELTERLIHLLVPVDGLLTALACE